MSDRPVIRNVEPDDINYRLIIADPDHRAMMTMIGPKITIHHLQNKTQEEVVDAALEILKREIMKGLCNTGRDTIQLNTMITAEKPDDDSIEVRLKNIERILNRMLKQKEDKLFEDDED